MVDLYRKTDRILILEKDDPKASAGLIDPEVFEGKNNLHLVQDLITGFWTFKYERGAVPPPLRLTFTSARFALDHATNYFKTKKIRIKEVQD